MSDSLQLLIVGLIVAVCAWRAIKRYAPKTAWRSQAGLSYFFERKGRPAWSRAFGHWLRPTEVATGDGCGSGCSTCGGCATNPVEKPNPLHIRLQG
ncbi:DUF6587 family protein [Arenimonas oryziterrae]|uniref:Uncharacterized protein n=1 Tax=Arenimonas oryziterrae DSM 21050 = YC6267 TaxID=1121015 RepID=A0A091ANX2_9GAMM|nr:DUF6587 family protein [Arenimonas oryziterrae]KFN41066.1 hypothetical protein N789_04055 [Arenimonas oryziterrae DSM 21050 = YC6267]